MAKRSEWQLDTPLISGTRKTFEPVGRCIYCGDSQRKLSEEHIIPFSLGGKLVLPKASCRVCADAINKFETRVQQQMLRPLRVHLGFPFRKKKQRPTHFDVPTRHPDGREEIVTVPADECPIWCAGVELPPPGMLEGRPADERSVEATCVLKLHDPQKWSQRLDGDGRLAQMADVDLDAIMALIAKIAHGFAVCVTGVDSFDHWLPPIFLRTDMARCSLTHLLGGGPAPNFSGNGPLVHKLQTGILCKGRESVRAVTVQLFAMLDMPTYRVVVGSTRAAPPT